MWPIYEFVKQYCKKSNLLTIILPCWLICNLLHCPVLRFCHGKLGWKLVTPVDLLSNLGMTNRNGHMYKVVTMKSLNTICFKYVAWGSKLVSHQWWFSALFTFNSPDKRFTCLPDADLTFLMNMWSIKTLGHIETCNLVLYLIHQKWPKWLNPTQLQPYACLKRWDTIIHAGIERWP